MQPFSGVDPTEDIRRFSDGALAALLTPRRAHQHRGTFRSLPVCACVDAALRTPRAVLSGRRARMPVSVVMEAAQMFMSARVASNVDVLTNALGAIARSQRRYSRRPAAGHALMRLRPQVRLTAERRRGLVLLALWLVTQLHPTARFSALGICATPSIFPWFIHTPHLQLAAEAAWGLHVLGLGARRIRAHARNLHRASR